MIRRPDSWTRQRSQLDVKMTPMIDVVFLLLIFFVWTASFRIAEQTLPSRLSAVTGNEPSPTNEPPPPDADFDQVVIRVLWIDGQLGWQINDNQVGSLSELRTRLESIAAIKGDAPVIVHPDPLVPMGHVVDVYDASRLAGFEEIRLAASEAV